MVLVRWVRVAGRYLHAHSAAPDASQRHSISPGDHALIPAHAEHQEVRRGCGVCVAICHGGLTPVPRALQINPGADKLVWVIVRSGSTPVTENIEDWSRST